MHGDWAAVFMLAIYLCSPQIDVVASEKGCIRELAVDHCRVLTTHTSVLLQSFFLREWSLHMSAAQYHLVDIVRLHAWFATVNNAQLTIYTQYTHKYTEDIHHKVQQSPLGAGYCYLALVSYLKTVFTTCKTDNHTLLTNVLATDCCNKGLSLSTLDSTAS